MGVNDESILIRQLQGRVVALEGGTGLTQPHARVYNSANLPITTGVLTALTFNSERWDNNDLHSTVSNTGRLTAPEDGLYLIRASVLWASTTSYRALRLRVNGTTQIDGDDVPTSGSAQAIVQSVATEYRLSADDYVEVLVQHFHGSDRNITAFGNFSPEFSMAKISA